MVERGNSTNGRLGILNDLWKYDQQTQYMGDIELVVTCMLDSTARIR